MKVERITTYDRFIEMKEEWNGLLFRSNQNIPFLTHPWFDAWWQSFGQNSELNILFFRDESNRLAGIAPLMIENNVLKFMASHEVTDYCDFIFSEDEQDEFYRHLWRHLHENFSLKIIFAFILFLSF